MRPQTQGYIELMEARSWCRQVREDAANGRVTLLTITYALVDALGESPEDCLEYAAKILGSQRLGNSVFREVSRVVTSMDARGIAPMPIHPVVVRLIETKWFDNMLPLLQS